MQDTSVSKLNGVYLYKKATYEKHCILTAAFIYTCMLTKSIFQTSELYKKSLKNRDTNLTFAKLIIKTKNFKLNRDDNQGLHANQIPCQLV